MKQKRIKLDYGCYKNINYFLNGINSSEFYYNGNNLLHRDNDLPAVITYYDNGELYNVSYFKEGVSHRDNDKPAIINYDYEGDIYKIEYYVDGNLQDIEEVERRIRLNKRKELLKDIKNDK